MTVAPTNWYSWDFRVMNGDRTLAVLDLSSWRERAEIQIEDRTHRVFRERAMSGDFILEMGGQILARATKPSVFRETMIIRADGREYTLRKLSVWRRAFVLMDGDRQIGSISPDSVWTRHATADLPADWPLPVKAFAIWLVIILWRRASNSAAAA